MGFRSFLRDYEAKYPEDVVHIEKEVDANQEIQAMAIKFEKQERYPLLVFHNVINAEGKKSEHWVAANVLASRTRQARICNSTFSDLGRVVYEASQLQKKPFAVIPKGEAPVREVVKTGNSINLFEFPATVHNEFDTGYYIDAGFVTTYDPDSGIDNCALQRAWIKEKDTLRIFISPRPTHNGVNMWKHDVMKQDMKCALWIGHHPLAYLGGLAKLPYPGSHWDAMGGMMGEPLRMVASESLGDDFLVPADAEVIVEGIVEAGRRYPEGPFGENSGCYGGQILNPQLKVTAITHRKDAIWYDIVTGFADHKQTGAAPIEGQLWVLLKPRFPSLQAVYMPLSGNGRYHAYLQFKNPVLSEARQAIMQACTVHGSLIKHCFAFDDDVDIFDEREVLWAIATRSQWDKNVMIFPETKRMALDPSNLSGAGTTGGIDCTIPFGESWEPRVNVGQKVHDKMKLEKYISPDILEKIKPDRQ